MKKTAIRMIVAALLLLAANSTPLLADGSMPSPPFCCPGCTCN